MTKRPYTQRGRLADVLALIQLLALDPHTHRSESAVIETELGLPSSAEEWIALAKEHPEFFRLSDEAKRPLSLVARDSFCDDTFYSLAQRLVQKLMGKRCTNPARTLAACLENKKALSKALGPRRDGGGPNSRNAQCCCSQSGLVDALSIPSTANL